MKKAILTIAIMAATMSAWCQTAAQKEEKASQRVDTAKARLVRAENQHDKTTKAYKEDIRAQLKNNNAKIAELKSKMVKPASSPANDALKKQVDELEARNVELRNKRDQ